MKGFGNLLVNDPSNDHEGGMDGFDEMKTEFFLTANGCLRNINILNYTEKNVTGLGLVEAVGTGLRSGQHKVTHRSKDEYLHADILICIQDQTEDRTENKGVCGEDDTGGLVKRHMDCGSQIQICHTVLTERGYAKHTCIMEFLTRVTHTIHLKPNPLTCQSMKLPLMRVNKSTV